MEIDPETIGPMIQKLIELLEHDDMDASEVLEELQSCLSGYSAELLRKIEAHVDEYDFSGAVVKTRELATDLGIK